MKYLIIIFFLLLAISTGFAHSGRTDKNGCHIDNSTGIKHCH